jgi:membrane-bound lytic murein transglycosylase A
MPTARQARFTGPLLALVAAALSGCGLRAPEPGVGHRIAWQQLPGWEQGRQSASWSALLASCRRLADEDPAWGALCAEARLMPDAAGPDRARAFLEKRFVPHAVHSRNGGRQGLITGYYEPLLHGSRERRGPYQHPLYAPPPELVKLELAEAFPQLPDQPLRGRLTPEGVVKPFWTRKEIESEPSPLAGHELIWVKSPIDRFFLHIQGSGRVRMAAGDTLAVRYADQNGHSYHSIGKELVERGELALESVTLDRLRKWLRDNPEARRPLFNTNPSYVFFHLAKGGSQPIGSLNVPLTPQRSVAADPRHIPPGAALWLDTTLPLPGGGAGPEFQRLVFAQDTGGAIRGPVRLDVFFGHGHPAEWLAGRMKQDGRVYYLRPAWRYPEADAAAPAAG